MDICPYSRSPLSEKSGSIPGSDFDDREPDFLRENSPPQLIKGTEMDMTEDSSTDSRSKVLPKPKTEKPRKGTGVIKNVAAIEALSLATEQTLKDINKWLDDTPRFSEFSSASNSPSHFLSAEEFENGSNRFDSDSKKPFKTEKPRMKDKDGVKKKKGIDLMKPKRKEVQRTIERLQPGKSKGNLITNLTKAKENVEESGLSIGLGLGKLVKESRNALLVKTDETAPKLSLGTVLKNDIIGFGKSKHSFDEKDGVKKEFPSEDPENEMFEEKVDVSKTNVNSAGFDNVAKKSPDVKSDVKNEEYSKDKENDYSDKTKSEDVRSQLPEEKERVAVKEITNKNKPTPNLSAWFKAFGAPKAPSTPKRRPEVNDPPPTLGRASLSPSQESRSELAFKSGGDGKEKDKTWYQDTFRNSPNPGNGSKDKIEAPPSVEMEEPRSVSVASPMPSPDIRPGSASSLVQPLSNLPPAPRQRKASTSSSMSERSSFSQDPMDGSSPHLSMDERLGGYPAPYPSPLHRSPVAASPVLASPKGEDINKSGYASINGTIRVGFYQDTSSNLQKSSPEKQSPNSNSPRDQSNSSPFQTYSSYVYPPTVSQSANMASVYGQSTHSAPAGNYPSYPSGTSSNPAGLYENLSQYSLSSMMNYADQPFRSTKPQENYNFSPRPSSYSNPEAAAKPPSSVFPVKKRLYAEIEAGRLQIPSETPKIMDSQRSHLQSSQNEGSGNRNLYPDPRDASALSFSSLQQPEMHLQSSQQYDRFSHPTARLHQTPDISRYQSSDSSSRLTCDLSKPTHDSDGKDSSITSQPLPYSVEPGNNQGNEVENLPRFHPEISRLQLPADYSKMQQNDMTKMLSDPSLSGEIGKSKYGISSPENPRGLGNLMDNLGRLQPQPIPNPVSSANRACYSSPMEAAGLGRLLQPPVNKNTITEDSDGVFRNKYPSGIDAIAKLQPSQQSFPGQDDGKLGYGAPANLGRISSAVSSPESRTPCTASYQSSMDASLRQNLSNLSHIVDRYQAEERLIQQSAFFSDKNLANIYSKSVSSCGAMYSQSGLGKVSNPSGSAHSQVSCSRESDLNIPKPGNFSDAKKSRKKPGKSAELVPTSASGSGNTAFQQYVGLKSNEPPAISLKTASVVPGSAFNFGPAPTGLGLPNTLYSEKDAYSGFLDDFRSQPSTYYSMVAAAAHHRSTPDPSAEKTSHSSGSGNTFTFLGHPQSRPSGYPALPQFVNPHQAGLMDPGTASSPLYQQYLQRLQEEQLRHSGVLHQGLLGPSSGYPSGYHHPALGIPRQSYDRPSWL